MFIDTSGQKWRLELSLVTSTATAIGVRAATGDAASPDAPGGLRLTAALVFVSKMGRTWEPAAAACDRPLGGHRHAYL